jgi:hypothetical protein
MPALSGEEKHRFSAVTFDAMMYVAERLMETGHPLIIEGNFVPAGVKKTDEAGIIKTLLDQHACRPLAYKFKGDTEILYKRFIKREQTPERGQVNVFPYEPSCDEFDGWCRSLDGFSVGGETIEIDTTDFKTVDFEKHIEAARLFVNKSRKG